MASFAFDSISTGQRVPGSQVEISNVRALQGLPPAVQKILLIGQCIGAASTSAPVRVTRGFRLSDVAATVEYVCKCRMSRGQGMYEMRLRLKRYV